MRECPESATFIKTAYCVRYYVYNNTQTYFISFFLVCFVFYMNNLYAVALLGHVQSQLFINYLFVLAIFVCVERLKIFKTEKFSNKIT